MTAAPPELYFVDNTITRKIIVKLTKLLIALFVVAMLPGWGALNLGSGVPAAGGGGGNTDFTEDANCVGAWLVADSTSEGAAEADACGSFTMSYVGSTFAVGSSVPAGTADGQESASLDGTGDYFTVATDTAFEASDFTAGCWVYRDSDTASTFFGKGDVENWELKYLTQDKPNFEVNNTSENGLDDPDGAGFWNFQVLRYDGSGTSADVNDDEVTMWKNGTEDVCNSGCPEELTSPSGNSDPVRIGANEAGGAEFTGDMMECAYFDKVLSDTELTEWMLCGLRGDANGTARDAAFGNDSCDGAGSPYDCCTGVDTGTCSSCDDITTCC